MLTMQQLIINFMLAALGLINPVECFAYTEPRARMPPTMNLRRRSICNAHSPDIPSDKMRQSDRIFNAAQTMPLATRFGQSPSGTGAPTILLACAHQCDIGVQINI